jgi:hypothetical protein
MGQHQATLIIWGAHYTVHIILNTPRHIVAEAAAAAAAVVVVVVVVVEFASYDIFITSILAAVSVFLFSVSFTLFVRV